MLCNCGGTFTLTPNGHRALYQSEDKRLSCYTDKCCYPWHGKVMICAEPSIDNVMVNVIITPAN